MCDRWASRAGRRRSPPTVVLARAYRETAGRDPNFSTAKGATQCCFLISAFLTLLRQAGLSYARRRMRVPLPGMTSRPAWLVPLFVLSGANGLCFEILWARQLQVVVGATSKAITLVVGLFMVGLALGGALGGSLPVNGDRRSAIGGHMNRYRPRLAANRAVPDEHLVTRRIHVDIGFQVERVLLPAIGTLVKFVHGFSKSVRDSHGNAPACFLKLRKPLG